MIKTLLHAKELVHHHGQLIAIQQNFGQSLHISELIPVEELELKKGKK